MMSMVSFISNIRMHRRKNQEIAETADEKEWESPVTMYLLSNVNVREQADKESKSLKVLSTGTEVKAVAIVPELNQSSGR